ncbi:unnamed protein product, partial [Mesorhabditis belari]|uniref:Uncharacterized protein n=1 Tax=Mesorhabditis belari TaxID=2138241 RepID=A0AAF3FGI0_9BILA
MGEVTKEEIESEIELKFWLVFIGYIVCSMAWIAYCFISHRRDVESLKQMEEYWVNRQVEQERLLQKYDSVQVDAAIRRSLLVETNEIA